MPAHGDHLQLLQSGGFCKLSVQWAQWIAGIAEWFEEFRGQPQLFDERVVPVLGLRVVELRGAGNTALLAHFSGQPVGQQVGDKEQVLGLFRAALSCFSSESS